MKHLRLPAPWVALLTAAVVLPGCDRHKKQIDEDPILAKSPGTSPIATQPPSLRSEDITRAVRSELEGDAGVVATGIQVSTNAGVVELTGRATDLLSKERATRLAQAVRGVISVSNRIDVQPAAVADDQLAAHVHNALVLNPTTDSLDMKTTARSGVVTLSGKVDSWVEKDTAERVAKGIRGVREVQNELAVAYKGKRSDAEIDSDVESRLRWDALVNDGLIEVRVEEGTAKLSGFVGSAAERDRAYRLAASVPGARDVETQDLAVRWWAKDEDLRSTAIVRPTDRAIHDAIKTAALVDPRVKSYNVQPAVSRRLVTLTGEVDNPRAKLAAESLARNTVGVLDVKNDIVVAPAKPIADSKLKARIISALAMNPFTTVGEVKVEVKDGVVRLTGSVENHFESAQAEDVATQLRGVRQVRNELQVKHPEKAYVFDAYLEPFAPAVSIWRYVPRTTVKVDREIQREIVEELTWSPFVDADQVDVRVFDGMATLTGNVDSISELRAATENAFEGGALKVDNRLKVSG